MECLCVPPRLWNKTPCLFSGCSVCAPSFFLFLSHSPHPSILNPSPFSLPIFLHLSLSLSKFLTLYSFFNWVVKVTHVSAFMNECHARDSLQEWVVIAQLTVDHVTLHLSTATLRSRESERERKRELQEVKHHIIELDCPFYLHLHPVCQVAFIPKFY